MIWLEHKVSKIAKIYLIQILATKNCACYLQQTIPIPKGTNHVNSVRCIIIEEIILQQRYLLDRLVLSKLCS